MAGPTGNFASYADTSLVTSTTGSPTVLGFYPGDDVCGATTLAGGTSAGRTDPSVATLETLRYVSVPLPACTDSAAAQSLIRAVGRVASQFECVLGWRYHRHPGRLPRVRRGHLARDELLRRHRDRVPNSVGSQPSVLECHRERQRPDDMCVKTSLHTRVRARARTSRTCINRRGRRRWGHWTGGLAWQRHVESTLHSPSSHYHAAAHERGRKEGRGCTRGI
jgi:hypothetical protein